MTASLLKQALRATGGAMVRQGWFGFGLVVLV